MRLPRPGKNAKGRPGTLSLSAVQVSELAPPPDQPPVEEPLHTSEPISTREEIAMVFEGYRTRWSIEEQLEAVKTGCACESCQ